MISEFIDFVVISDEREYRLARSVAIAAAACACGVAELSVVEEPSTSSPSAELFMLNMLSEVISLE